jgi:hypothetical protein
MKTLTLRTFAFLLLLCLFCIPSCTNDTPKKIKAIVISEQNTQDVEQGYIEPKSEDTITTTN